jgi:mannan endo-1,4-beta-mannosidase
MLKNLRYAMRVTLILLVLVGQSFSTPGVFAAQPGGFVQRKGNTLMLDGKQFRFAGSSNYYLMYKSQFMVDDVLKPPRQQL